jgi:hypothetical protein
MAQGQAVPRLPRDVRGHGLADRRGLLRHPGPLARGDRAAGTAPQEARLLCETHHAHHRRVSQGGPDGPGSRRGHHGHLGFEHQRGGLPHLRADLGRGDRSGARAAHVERPALVAAGNDASRGEDAVPDTWIGTCGSGRRRCGRSSRSGPRGIWRWSKSSGVFTTAVYHPWNFRGWWDFGTGSLGDMGCHHANTPFRALKLTHPTSVSAMSSKVMPETAPLASIVTYEFPAREDMPPVRVVWYDGGLKPLSPRPGFPLPAAARCTSATRDS